MEALGPLAHGSLPAVVRRSRFEALPAHGTLRSPFARRGLPPVGLAPVAPCTRSLSRIFSPASLTVPFGHRSHRGLPSAGLAPLVRIGPAQATRLRHERTSPFQSTRTATAPHSTAGSTRLPSRFARSPVARSSTGRLAPLVFRAFAHSVREDLARRCLGMKRSRVTPFPAHIEAVPPVPPRHPRQRAPPLAAPAHEYVTRKSTRAIPRNSLGEHAVRLSTASRR